MPFFRPVDFSDASRISVPLDTNAIGSQWFGSSAEWMPDNLSHELGECCVAFPGVVEMLEALNIALENSPSKLVSAHATHKVGRVVVYVTTRAKAGDLPLDLVDALDLDYVGVINLTHSKQMLRFSRKVSNVEEIALSVVVDKSVGLSDQVEKIWNEAFEGVGSPMTALKRFMTAGIRLA